MLSEIHSLHVYLNCARVYSRRASRNGFTMRTPISLAEAIDSTFFCAYAGSTFNFLTPNAHRDAPARLDAPRKPLK